MLSRKVGLIIMGSLFILGVAHLWGFGTLESAKEISTYIQSLPKLTAYLILFIWCFFLFLTVAPLGSFTILAAGYILGPMAGLVQFSALCLSSYVLYLWTHPKGQEAAYERVLKNKSAIAIVQRFRGHPTLAVCVLRIIPIVPSCLCVLTCSAFAIPGRSLYLGTLLTGWIRPLILAYIGSHTPTLLALIS